MLKTDCATRFPLLYFVLQLQQALDNAHHLFEGTRWPSHIHTIAIDAVADEVRNAPPNAYYVIVAQHDATDLAIAEAVLRRGDFGFLGLMCAVPLPKKYSVRLSL